MERFQPVWNIMKKVWSRLSPPIIKFFKRTIALISAFWKRKHLTQILILSSLTVVLLTILFFAFTASQANVQSLREGLTQTTVIYDKDGDVATKVDTNRTEGIDVKDLPEHVPNAVIAIEDRRFMEHNGFDLKGLTRAFFNNLFAGRITGGGSTITQQLAKNALLSPEQTYRRKIEELFLAVEIEKNYSKDEILSMYLNQVFFGSGSWGIDQAARKYFNKDIGSVTISEAALLAGLLQSPSALDPYRHYERAIERRNVVLYSMKELSMITDKEYTDAKNERIILEDGGGSYIKREFPYYVDAVLDEAIAKYGLTQEEIMTRGYRIYTEMDQNIQSMLENVYQRDSVFPTGKGGTLVQSGSVLLNPQSGGVLGLVGGRGDYVFRGFNRVTHMKAQPGSTIKPLAVYTPALEEGYETTSILKDEPLKMGDYAPENFSHTFQGEVPMYEAVEQSLNVPTVWLLNEIGLEKGIASLEKFGITLEKEDHYLGIALGGMRKGISPLQLAEAYSVFAHEGKREEAHFITKIIGPTGNEIAEYKKETTRVTTKRVANEMNSMLLGVVESGTGKGAQIPGLVLAGKTGSTQLPYHDINGTKDQWFVGYTPNIVGAVWLGYDQTDREHYLASSSSETVVPIFKTIMESIKPYIESAEFTTESVRTQQAEEGPDFERLLKEQSDKWREVFREEAPKWKEKLDQGIDKAGEKGRQLKDNIENFINP
ncbi:transglycosylase domain-containing protein [Bacillus tuaregi]|uniref:transglycosylase domain-containing protein n=1 Tax=Bacillus tuaregi TaxID=1816695 RepID=UPI000A44306E|nr:PBP1A family penicillin-binding protein [Bacillus tuaregi]